MPCKNKLKKNGYKESLINITDKLNIEFNIPSYRSLTTNSNKALAIPTPSQKLPHHRMILEQTSMYRYVPYVM